MLAAQAAWDENNVDRVIGYLKNWMPKDGAADFRDFAWYSLWKLAEGNAHCEVIPLQHTGQSVCCSKDGNTIFVVEASSASVYSRRNRSLTKFADFGDQSSFYQFSDLSEDEKWLATPHEREDTVTLYRVEDGIPTKVKEARVETDANVFDAKFSSDSQRLAVAHEGGVDLWNLVNGEWVQESTEGVQWPSDFQATCIAFNPTAPVLAIGSMDGRVVFLNLDSHEFLEDSFSHYFSSGEQVWRLAWSSDLVVSVGNGAIAYSMIQHAVVNRTHFHRDTVRGVAFTRNGREFMLGSRDGAISVWDATTFRQVGTLKGHSGIVQDIDTFETDSGWGVVSSSQDYSARIWRSERASRPERFPLQQGDAEPSVRLTSDGKYLRYSLVRTLQKQLYISSNLHNENPLSGTRRLSAANGVSEIREINLLTREDRTLLRVEKPCEWCSISSTELVAFGFSDGTVEIRNITEPQQIVSWPYSPDFANSIPRIHPAHFSPNGNLLFVRLRDNKVEARNTSDGSVKLTFETDSNSATCISADSRLIAVGRHRDRVVVLSSSDGSVIHDFKHMDKDHVSSMAFSEDGTRLVLGSFDNTGSVWDLSGKPALLCRIAGHIATVKHVSFADDERYVFTFGGDNRFKVWDTSTPNAVLRLAVGSPRPGMYHLGFEIADDRRAIATVSNSFDHFVSIFRFATPDEVERSEWWASEMASD